MRRKDMPLIYKRLGSEKVPFVIAFVLFTLYSISLLFPLAMMLWNSLKDSLVYNDQLFTHTIYKLPEVLHFENYVKAFEVMKVPTLYGDVYLAEMAWNTLWIGLTQATCNIFAHLCVAYACARYKFKLNKPLQVIALFVMIFPVYGTTGASLKLYQGLGLYDQPIGIFLSAWEAFGMSFFILMGYFKGISWTYAEAVFIDGGGHWTVFFRIMLPQVKTISLVFWIQTFLASYGDYQSNMLFMPSYVNIGNGLYQSQTILPRLGEAPVYFASLFLSCIPILIIYIFFGKAFMTSMNVGGLKG